MNFSYFFVNIFFFFARQGSQPHNERTTQFIHRPVAVFEKGLFFLPETAKQGYRGLQVRRRQLVVFLQELLLCRHWFLRAVSVNESPRAYAIAYLLNRLPLRFRCPAHAAGENLHPLADARGIKICLNKKRLFGRDRQISFFYPVKAD